MSLTQATRLLSPEEIAVQAGHQVPYLRLPDGKAIFAERETRLRQLAAGHAMREFLLFAAEIARAQHEELQADRPFTLPDAAAIDAASRAGQPPLAADTWPRDPAWRDALNAMLDRLLPRLGDTAAAAAVKSLRAADGDTVEQQAGRLLTGVMLGLDMAWAPLIGAGLQLYFTALVLQTDAARGADRLAPFGRTDDALACPCCGSKPVASVQRIGERTDGHRYLHCSLCSTQWHLVRIKCSHCGGTAGIGYQSLEALPGHAAPATGAAKDAVQAETCDTCDHYLKILHMQRDPHLDPVADDLASITLDLLVSEAGRTWHGVNLLLLFGDPGGP